jgi:hypothetical protein
MKRFFSLASLFLALPMLVHAQGLQTFVSNLVKFVNKTVIPFLLGIAFLIFAINAIRYFVFQGATEDGQKNAKNLATYGILAFVVILVFWGMVNLLAQSIGLEKKTAPTSDYVKMNGGNFTGGAARDTSGGNGGGGSNNVNSHSLGGSAAQDSALNGAGSSETTCPDGSTAGVHGCGDPIGDIINGL